ncbi:MAG TPA: BTAD domain-containing putative transcriptional regulator [Gaiellaceae bacterium]|nr:BTAD domain-containing putative transcriptional regulator [Gaiellaceae bacterium]
MEVRILGPLEVWDGGEQIPLRGSKQRALLAVLALKANEVVSNDRLVEELWGDDPPDAAALRVRVSQLRKALGDGGARLATQSPGYSLRLDRPDLDLFRFEDLVADSVGVDRETAASTLREALALWRGPALADFTYEPFAQASIARLEELRLAVLEQRIDADLALGRQRELVAEIDGLTSEHPLRERLRALHMLALYRSGRQSDALAVFASTRRLLVDELGLEPGPALRELEAAILRQDPALDLEAAPSPKRSILIAPSDASRFDDLLALGEPLARRPARELILAQLIDSARDLAEASALARERRQELQSRGVSARAAAFTTESRAADLVRIATEQDVDLLLIEAPPALLDDDTLRGVLLAAPCDVAAFVARDALPAPGAVLVPFTGAEHDWSAVELGAWIARSHDTSLLLAGPMETARDSSRLLARASLAVQRALGVAAEPLLVEPGAQGLVDAARDAALLVLGLSDRWMRDGLGRVRQEVVEHARPPVLVVRRGARPGGLAPPESHTRFTWSIAAR